MLGIRHLECLESDTFNLKISLCQTKMVQCSPTMVGLKHVERLFREIMLAPGVLHRIMQPTESSSITANMAKCTGPSQRQQIAVRRSSL